MDEVTLQRIIASELKEMRKGGGLAKYDMSGNSLLAIVYDRDNQLASEQLEKELMAVRHETGVEALVAALAIGSHGDWPNASKKAPAELTMRRRDFAEKTGLSERTLSRHEDEAIEALSWRLARRFQDEVYQKRIREQYDQPEDITQDHITTWLQFGTAHPNQGNARPRAKPSSSRTNDLPTDIPGLVKRQRTLLNDIDRAMMKLKHDTGELAAINKRLAEMWGVTPHE